MPAKKPKAKVPLAPKLAPTVQKASVPAPIPDADSTPLAWEKPEWTKKPVLRNTSKGAKLKEGGEIARGGIRPVEK
jgi:hypothetical protein